MNLGFQILDNKSFHPHSAHMNRTIHIRNNSEVLSDDENLDGYLKSKSLGNRNNVSFRYNLAVALEIIISPTSQCLLFYYTFYFYSPKQITMEYLGSFCGRIKRIKRKIFKKHENRKFAFLLFALSKYIKLPYTIFV
jgi:hypothetical protein